MKKHAFSILFIHLPVFLILCFALFFGAYLLYFGEIQALRGDPKDILPDPALAFGWYVLVGYFFYIVFYPLLYSLVKFFKRSIKPEVSGMVLIWLISILLFFARLKEVLWFLD